MMTQPDWIAVDWGTSNFRAWACSRDGTVLKQVQSDRGMGKLAPEDFEAVLLDAIQPFLGSAHLPIICCGMVGAKQGWQEAPYAKVPCEPAQFNSTIHVPTKDERLDVHILGGMSQSAPADVMRGEETQIAGFIDTHPDFEGVLCLPGTHTKWVHISAREIVSFRTFMTGELFALLSDHSVLKYSVMGGDWDQSAFEAGLDSSISAPQMAAAHLFGLRAEGLVNGMTPSVARSRLSGMLIGLELAGSKPYWLGQEIVVIGDPKLSEVYVQALGMQHAPAKTVNADQLTLSGLFAAYRHLKGTS